MITNPKGSKNAVRLHRPDQPNRSPRRQNQSRDRCRDPNNDGDPFETERSDQVGHGQDGNPQRARVRLDSFAGVEHRSVAGRDLMDDPQIDEAVVDDAAVRPRTDRQNHDGYSAHGCLRDRSWPQTIDTPSHHRHCAPWCSCLVLGRGQRSDRQRVVTAN